MQQPQIISKPGFTVVGMKIRTNNQNNDIPQLWTRFSPRMYEVKHIQRPIVAYGMMGSYDEGSGEFDYIAAYGVTDAANVPADMGSWDVPAQTYAVFPCTMSTIRPTYDEIYGQWLPASTYRRTSGPEFELYDENFEITDADPKFFIYIPVEMA